MRRPFGGLAPITGTEPDLKCRSWLSKFEATASVLGFKLYEWQRRFLHVATEMDRGIFRREACAAETTRQMGKSVCFEVAGLTGAAEGLHVAITAQDKSKAMEKWHEAIILWQENTPEEMHGKLYLANGKERWTHPSGGIFRPVTCTAKSARSYTLDWVLMDESAWLLRGEEFEAAAEPARLTRKNPLTLYMTSAGDRADPSSRFFSELRRAARSHPDGEVAWMDWECPAGLDWGDEATWHRVVPILSEKTPMAKVVLRNLRKAWRRAVERGTEATFAREYLSVWTEVPGAGDLTAEAWNDLAQPGLTLKGENVWLALDIAPDRSHAAIVAAEAYGLDDVKVKMVHDQNGTTWIAPYLKKWIAETPWFVTRLVYDERSGAGAFIPFLDAAGIPLHKMEWREFASSYGRFLDLCSTGGLAHDGHTAFSRSVDSAAPRVVLDTLAWDRAGSSPICALVAATVSASFAMANR